MNFPIYGNIQYSYTTDKNTTYPYIHHEQITELKKENENLKIEIEKLKKKN